MAMAVKQVSFYRNKLASRPILNFYIDLWLLDY